MIYMLINAIDSLKVDGSKQLIDKSNILIEPRTNVDQYYFMNISRNALKEKSFQSKTVIC